MASILSLSVLWRTMSQKTPFIRTLLGACAAFQTRQQSLGSVLAVCQSRLQVDRRWAMTTKVESANPVRMVCWIAVSVALSSALVASPTNY